MFPDNVPTTAHYFKIGPNGWHEVAFGSNDGDNMITLTLTDNNADHDADPALGMILDPGALATSVSSSSTGTSESSSGSSGCFIGSLFNRK